MDSGRRLGFLRQNGEYGCTFVRAFKQSFTSQRLPQDDTQGKDVGAGVSQLTTELNAVPATRLPADVGPADLARLTGDIQAPVNADVKRSSSTLNGPRIQPRKVEAGEAELVKKRSAGTGIRAPIQNQLVEILVGTERSHGAGTGVC